MAYSPLAYAIKLLARREYSAYELQNKLKVRFSDLSRLELETLLHQLQNAGYQSDQRFTEVMLRHKIQQGYGWRYIKQFFQQHAISSPLLKQALAEVQPDWKTLAAAMLAKRKHLKPDEPLEKRMRYLLQRGFNYDDVAE